MKFSSVSVKPSQPQTICTVSFCSIPSRSITACTRGRMAEIPMVSRRPLIRIMTPSPQTLRFCALLNMCLSLLMFSIISVSFLPYRYPCTPVR